jgi:hypothetical protein
MHDFMLLLLLLVFLRQSGAIGQLKQLAVQVLIPAWAFPKDDIRFQAKLAGVRMHPLAYQSCNSQKCSLYFTQDSSGTTAGAAIQRQQHNALYACCPPMHLLAIRVTFSDWRHARGNYAAVLSLLPQVAP